ncbi:MAG: sulfatase [Caulobacteraceae bacterium]
MGATRREFAQLVGAGLAPVGGAKAATNSASGPPRPNIVYIHSHDSGRYLRPYGHDVPTPNLMRLARQGVLFRQAHCASPGCSPSRAALLTGQAAHSSGMLGLAHLGWGLHDYRQHLLHTLRGHGYRSVLAGLQHIAKDPRAIGFDEMLPHRSDHASDVSPVAARYILSRPKQPFFLDVGFFETHRDFPDPVDNPDYILPPSPMPDNSRTRIDMAGFHASARQMDKGVGRVLDALDKAELASNTLVLSTTDHGIAFPDMKCNLLDGGTGVSMIMRGPGVFSQPGMCDALISQIDVFPSLCEYLQIETPAWVQGRSFLPILRGETAQINDAVYGEVTYHASYQPMRSVRTERWKYIRRFDGRTAPNLPNCDDGASKAFWVKEGWRQQPVAPEELYDLVFDPAEKDNLIAAERTRQVAQDMRQRLDAWMKRTGDPLLKGPVPLPPHGLAVDPNALSPEALRGTIKG